MTKVSVCIPVYNCEKFINESIDSVLKQTFQDFEIVVLDNKSTDNTVSVVEQYTDARIKIYKNDSNIGMVGNWNKVMTHAKGEYIKILPADDAIYPDCLAKQVSILDNDKSQKVALVCGRKRIVDDNGKEYFTRGYSKREMQVDGVTAINKTIRSGGNIIGEPGVVMFRKSILEKTGNFDATIYYTMDLHLWFKMLLHGDLYVLSDVVSIFRISGNSESVKIFEKQKKDLRDFAAKIYSSKEFRVSWWSYLVSRFAISTSVLAKKFIYKRLLK
jgi:glycosyltransferase involved in cell wall biosynthesis